MISLPPHEMLPRLFQKEMVRRNIVWRTAMQTSSQDSVSIYVATDSGPDSRCRRQSCCAIPDCGAAAERIPQPTNRVFWRGRSARLHMFVDELAGRAKRIFGKPEEDWV